MKIAIGNRRTDKCWKNSDISWEDFCLKISSTLRTTETVEEYQKMKKGRQDEIKDVGGFVGGHLAQGRVCLMPQYADAGYGLRYARCVGANSILV